MEDALAHADIRQRTANSLLTRYDVDITQAMLVMNTCVSLLKQVAKPWKLQEQYHKDLLSWAAMLHEVGLQINSRGVQRHSAYILQNIEMPGFNQEQQELLATLVRFHRKKIRLDEIPEFYQFDSLTVYKLLSLLRLSALLNIKRQEDGVPNLEVTAEKLKLIIGFPQDWLENKPIIAADLEREKQYLEVLDLTLQVT
jgi:exopolyphosphatase/guanosine-5'-triphosphate,3'-diphosphate pyrophosphatase